MSLQKKLDATQKVIDGLEAEAHAGLLQAYRKALYDLRAELAQIYAKYEVAGKLTYSEASKYGRLKSLFENVAGQIKDLTGETHDLTRELAGSVYQQSFYRTAFALETEAKVRLGFGLLNPAAINASVQNKLKGITLNGRLAANRSDVIRRLRDAITQGMIRGESYADVAKRIKDILGRDVNRAMRIASTETHRNYMQGFVDADDKAGESGLKTTKEWITTFDGHTRKSHQDMNRVQADEDGMFTLVSGDNEGAKAEAPGLFEIEAEDINCRCRPITVIKGYEPELRRARDDKGDNVVIDANMTYQQWYDEYIAD